MTFQIPARCTENSVNTALKEQGYRIQIYLDPTNDWRFSVYVVLPNGDGATAIGQLTPWHKNTARAAAEFLAEYEEALELRAKYWFNTSIYRTK